MPKHVAGRQKKALKHAKSKHAEARGKKKHAGRTASLHANDQTLTCQNQTCRSTSQADRRKRFNVPNANMPKHAERRNMPEGPHLCMQMTKLKHAKIKHAEARRRPTEESASTCQKQTCRSTRKEETCRKDRIFACKRPISLH